MKILQISSEKAWRGGEQQIAYLINELSEHKAEVMVACRKGSAFEEYCERMKIPYKSLPFRNSMDIASARQLKKLCSEWKPDLIHVHSSKGYGITWLADLMGLRVPIILSRRVAFNVKGNFINKLKYNHSRLRKIICVTEAVRQEILPLVSDKDKTCVVYSGIDNALFNPDNKINFLKTQYNLPETAFLIGTTAAFTKEKDYRTFFRTAQHVLQSLPGEPIIFLAIGEGPEKQEMQEFCKALKIEEKVCFTGFVPKAGQFIHELDIFLFTSRNEGLGSSILDAFASCLPVVSTAAGGIPEIVEHEKTGLLAAPGDYLTLSQAIQRLYQSPDLRKKFAKNAHQVVKGFDKKITAQKTIEIYSKALHEFN